MRELVKSFTHHINELTAFNIEASEIAVDPDKQFIAFSKESEIVIYKYSSSTIEGTFNFTHLSTLGGYVK